MKLVDAERLREIAEVEFADIVAEAFVPDVNELRIILTDGSNGCLVSKCSMIAQGSGFGGRG